MWLVAWLFADTHTHRDTETHQELCTRRANVDNAAAWQVATLKTKMFMPLSGSNRGLCKLIELFAWKEEFGRAATPLFWMQWEMVATWARSQWTTEPWKLSATKLCLVRYLGNLRKILRRTDSGVGRFLLVYRGNPFREKRVRSLSSLSPITHFTFGEVHSASCTLYIIFVVQCWMLNLITFRLGCCKSLFVKGICQNLLMQRFEAFRDFAPCSDFNAFLNAPIPTPFVHVCKVPFSIWKSEAPWYCSPAGIRLGWPSNPARRRYAVASSSACASCEHQVWGQDVSQNCETNLLNHPESMFSHSFPNKSNYKIV